MFGANLWHWSHFLTYSCASFCISSHQYPWVMARWDGDLPPCDFHKFLYVVPLGVTLISQDVHKADMAQKKNIYTTFCRWTTKTEELSFVFSQLLVSPQAIYPFRGIVVWGPSSSAPNWLDGFGANLSSWGWGGINPWQLSLGTNFMPSKWQG